MSLQDRMMGVVQDAVADGKLGVDEIVGTIQRILQIVKDAAGQNRQQIEEWADAAVKWLATKIPNPILGALASDMGPRLIDFALDEAFGPDADNT